MATDAHDRTRDRAAPIDVPYPPRRRDRDVGTVRVPAAEPLAVSYRTQHLRLGIGGRPVDVVPTRSVGPGPLPVPVPAHVVTAWSAGGQPATVARNLAAGRRLRAHLDALGVVHRRGTAYAPDRSWAEEVAVVEGMDDAGAAALGRLLAQPAVVRLDGTGLQVLPTGLADLGVVGHRGWAVRPATATCPMRRDAPPGAVCRNPGGPWVSRSMEVGMVWAEHQALLTGLLGCGGCADGALPPPGVGRPVALAEALVASRWGGWQFGGPLDPLSG